MTTWKEVAKEMRDFIHYMHHYSEKDTPDGELPDYDRSSKERCAAWPCDQVDYPMVDGRKRKD